MATITKGTLKALLRMAKKAGYPGQVTSANADEYSALGALHRYNSSR